ncbi:MAG: peptidoglycan editing factor PgeF [Chlamydiota bacterium]|nr:peptidoglycan editing factor PgeF [Chlamydiota bacterium]
MLKKNDGDIEWLEFELLSQEKGLEHRVYLKHGGCSRGKYASLNFSMSVGDNPSDVKASMEKISSTLPVRRFVRGNFVHGNRVINIENYSTVPSGEFDGMVTGEKHVGLIITHADCQAAVIYDPIRRAVANVHCGWRGNVAKIYTNAIAMMERQYRSNPKDLLVGIAPSLGPDHAEFVNYQVEFPREFHKFQVKPNHFNLWEVAREELESCGVLPDNIEIAGICTYSNPEDFFSYRRCKRSGRHGTVAVLI